MVDQGPYPSDEADRVRQAGVALERRLVLPARVDVEELRVASRPERVDGETARLLARWREDVEQRLSHRVFLAGSCMKSREEEHLHGSANLHFPTLSTTPVQSAINSFQLSLMSRAAVCTITSFRVASTKIACPRAPSNANCRSVPGMIHVWYP